MQHSPRDKADRAAVYAATSLSAFAVFFGIAYALASYFGYASFAELTSFRPADWPRNVGPAPTNGLSFGIHYFGDFLATWAQTTSGGSPYDPLPPVLPSNYLPFVHLLLTPLTWIDYPVAAIIALTAMGCAVLGAMWYAASLQRGRTFATKALVVVGGVLLTQPFIAIIDRGNVQGIVCAVVVAAVLAVSTGHYRTAAILIGLAAAVKGYPIIFLILLIRQRRWIDSLVGVAVALVLTIGSLLTFSGGLFTNLAALWRATAPFREGGSTVTPAFDQSLRTWITSVGESMGGPLQAASTAMVDHYMWVVVVALIMCMAIALAPGATLLEQVLALTVFITLTPAIVGSYALSTYFAAVALIFSMSLRRTARSELVYAVLLGLIVAPRGVLVLAPWHSLTLLLGPPLQLGLLLAVVTFVVRRRTRGFATLGDGNAYP